MDQAVLGRDADILLFSVHSTFSQKILAGTKSIELRRSMPSARPGQLVAIYETLPRGAIVATAQVAELMKLPKLEMWARYSSELGIDRAEYDRYLSGKSEAVGLRLSNVVELASPVDLKEMRALGVANPPQQWMFLRFPFWRARLCVQYPEAA